MSIGRVPGATGIQPSIVTAKGDLIVATASGSVTNQAVGSNNQVLMADSAQADGVKWANEATATLTTTGDLLYASAANTPARLGIGSSSQVLTVSGGVPTWATPAGGGKVLQVIQAVTQNNISISTSTFTDSDISATITPSSTSSKVLVLVNGAQRHERSTSSSRQTLCEVQLMRGSTSVYNDSSGRSFQIEFPSITTGVVDHFTRVNLNYLDSPATTSATTYKVQYRNLSAGTLTAQGGSAMSSIILLEIGA